MQKKYKAPAHRQLNYTMNLLSDYGKLLRWHRPSRACSEQSLEGGRCVVWSLHDMVINNIERYILQ